MPNDAQETRSTLLTELAARLSRDRMLRYASRELEMQKQLMSKGASRKIAGVEKINSEEDKEVDEDELDANWKSGSKKNVVKEVGEEGYRPRVYKWRAERKK